MAYANIPVEENPMVTVLKGAETLIEQGYAEGKASSSMKRVLYDISGHLIKCLETAEDCMYKGIPRDQLEDLNQRIFKFHKDMKANERLQYEQSRTKPASLEVLTTEKSALEKERDDFIRNNGRFNRRTHNNKVYVF